MFLWARSTDLSDKRISALQRVKEINPSIITALDNRPTLSSSELLLFQSYSLITRPARDQRRRVYLPEITAAFDVYKPQDELEFVEFILSVENQLWKESSESESTSRAR